MFSKFFEEGLLVDESTLMRNPEVYKSASQNFMKQFKEDILINRMIFNQFNYSK